MARRGTQEWRDNIRRAKLANPSTGYGAIHHMLRQHRTGQCSECGKDSATDMAYKRHPEPYTRNLDDYHELCRSCHRTLYPQSQDVRARISETMKLRRVQSPELWAARWPTN